MDKLKILFVTSEIDPFLKLSSAADLIRLLPQKLQEKGHQIRILMPKFGVINERRNRLHEVVRLSGINIKVGEEEKPLTIKVASITSAKLQVYFLDNEDYFKRKAVLKDPKNDKYYKDNDERSIFFCKGAIETVKKLGWTPDIIHCHDWMTSFIPLYLKTTYKDDPMFKNTKVVYTLYDNGFEGQLPADFLDKTNIDGDKEDIAKKFSSNNYVGLSKGGISFADKVTKGHPMLDDELEDFLEENDNDVYFDSENSEEYVNNYQELYTNVLN